MKRLWLYLRNKNPQVVYFTANSPVAINDLPLVVQWKVNHCWKAEITGLGRVRRKGLFVLNNYRQHQELELKAWGRKNTCVTQVLSLNHKRHSLQPFLESILDEQAVASRYSDLEGKMCDLEQRISGEQEYVIQQFEENAQRQQAVPSFDFINVPRLFLPVSAVENSIKRMEDHQQAYFLREFQLQNPENFTSTNLYQ